MYSNPIRPCLVWLALLPIMGMPSAAWADMPDPIPDEIAAAIADARRPIDQRGLDAARKPARIIAFAGIKSGDRVADFMPGNAYFTRIFSSLVGPAGRVYAFVPAEQMAHCPASEIAGTLAIARDPGYANVTVIAGDGMAGAPERAPFDRIIVTAAAEEIPQALTAQLAKGGKMVVPVGPRDDVQHIVRLTKEVDGTLTREKLIAVRFVPLLPGQAREL